MATVKLAKVMVTPKGEYSSATQYEALDIVSNDGASWLALKAVKGVTPVNGEYWMRLAAKGDTGVAGPAPAVTASKTGKVTTVTITGSNGAQTLTINDGADGEGAGDMFMATYDTNGDGVVDNADNAQKLNGKADTAFAASEHTHAISGVTGLQSALDAKLSAVPTATTSVKGCVIVGAGLSVTDDGTLSNAYAMSYSSGTLAITGP